MILTDEERLCSALISVVQNKRRCAAWLVRNREENKRRSREWRLAHPEQAKTNKRNWDMRNPEKSRLSKRRWEHNNLEKCRAKVNKRRALKAGNGGSYTAAQFSALGDICLCCGRKGVTTDHVVPLSKGGTSDISNIQPLCLPCNDRKGVNIIDYRSSFPLESTSRGVLKSEKRGSNGT